MYINKILNNCIVNNFILWYFKIFIDANSKLFLIGSSNANIVIMTFSPTTLSSNIKSGTYPITSMYSFTSAVNSTLSRDRFDIIVSTSSDFVDFQQQHSKLRVWCFCEREQRPCCVPVRHNDNEDRQCSQRQHGVQRNCATQLHLSVAVDVRLERHCLRYLLFMCFIFWRCDRSSKQQLRRRRQVRHFSNVYIEHRIDEHGRCLKDENHINDTESRQIDSGNYLIGGNSLSFEKVNSTLNQAIIFKSDISLNFGSFSWYDMGTNITYNLLSLTPTYTAMSSSNGMNAVSKSSLPGFLNIGNPTASTFDIVNVTSFYPKPEGTYTTLDATNTTIYPWHSIAPTLLTAIPDKRYDISYTTPSDTITPQYSQWQNVPMLYDLYIDSSKSYPDWANFTSSTGSLLVSPAFAQASDMKDSNVTYVAIPNTGNLIETGFKTTITLYNELPVLYLNYTNTTIVAYHPSSVEVKIEDPEGNSVFL